jgi:site-specific DNA-methyltransferase (adenine-specific)
MQTIQEKKLIITEGRQRQEFDPIAMAELSEAILARGLMHAVVVRESPEGLVLVAGERRLRAMKDLWMLGGQLKFNGEIVPEGEIPYVTLGQLAPLEAEEAELSENLHRKDLTWQENSAAMAKLHSLRSRQAQAEGRVHTVADTAMETKGRSDGGYQAAVRKDLVVAKFLHLPEIAKAKTADEAFKILKRQEESQRNVALAAEVGKTFTQSIHELHNTNCLSWMRSAEANQFDVILTDPPYGMGADSFGDAAGKLGGIEHHYKDDYDHWKSLMDEWCGLAFRVAKPQAHAYVFCDLDNFHELKRMMTQAGWWVTRTPFICTKPNSGRVPHPEHGPRRQWEMILYAIKGKKPTTGIYPDVITTMADPNMSHGAQKPVALYLDLLKRSVRAGDTVLDSFAGSGTIFPAAHAYKVKAVGIEMNPEYYSLALQRMKGLDESATLSQAQGNALANELQSLMRK